MAVGGREIYSNERNEKAEQERGERTDMLQPNGHTRHTQQPHCDIPLRQSPPGDPSTYYRDPASGVCCRGSLDNSPALLPLPHVPSTCPALLRNPLVHTPHLGLPTPPSSPFAKSTLLLLHLMPLHLMPPRRMRPHLILTRLILSHLNRKTASAPKRRLLLCRQGAGVAFRCEA